MSPIKVDPEIMGGTPCFTGTRVPIKNLFDYIEGNYSLDEFLEHFPSVTREQVDAVLELAQQRLLGAEPATRWLLLDECLPVPLRHHLVGHTVETVLYRGWKGIRNGRLARTGCRGWL